MAKITAKLVQELRKITEAGMMECKKALIKTKGDLDLAITTLRKLGQAKAVKRGSRITAEGLVVLAKSENAKKAALLEINCETDFVAKDKSFSSFATALVQLALKKQVTDLKMLSTLLLHDGHSVEEERLALIAKMGENISIRRVALLEAPKTGCLESYLHGGQETTRIAAIVILNKQDHKFAKDLAMHIVAMNPEYASKDDIPAERIAKEEEIFLSLAKEQHKDKRQDILKKIILGQVNKQLDSITLVGQPFVKDPKIKVGQLLKNKNVNLLNYIRYEVGKSIEKKEVDFVTDVMNQTKGE